MDKQWNLYADTNKYSELIIPDFIKKLKKPAQKIKIIRFLKLLMRLGPELHRPYADLLQKGIYELRIKIGGNHLRILYNFIKMNNIILTQAFYKNQDKIPQIIIRHTLSQVETYHKQIENGNILPKYFISIHDFIDELFNENDFVNTYVQNCEICEYIVKLVSRIYKQNLSIEKIAAMLDIELNSLTMLEQGEKCRPDIILKLSKFLNMPISGTCKKLNAYINKNTPG